MSDQNELRVLHALRLKGFADTEPVAELAEVSVDVAKQVLDGLAESEMVQYRESPRMSGWRMLAPGRARGEELLAAELDAAGKRDELDALYRQFLELNKPFLGLCTEWQTREVDGEQVLNDHSDAAYDAAVIGRLEATDGQMQPICADLAALLPRFGNYGPDFASALGKVKSGDTDWFTGAMIDSYHTVWFHLHEDLLASLGIERAKEGHA